MATIKEFRDAADALGRFASIREKAPEPTDRIVVQGKNGILKLVAGTEEAAVVVTLGEHAGNGDGKALVSARLLLQAAKSLRGKGDVSFDISPAGAILRTSLGGQVSMPNVGTALPRYKVVAGVLEQTCHFGEGAMPILAAFIKMLDNPLSFWLRNDAVLYVEDGVLIASGTDNHLHFEMRIGETASDDWLVGRVASGMLAQCCDFEAPGSVTWGQGGLVVHSGPYRASTGILEARGGAWQVIADGPPTRNITSAARLDRKVLIAAVKGVKPTDEHQRVSIFAPQIGRDLVIEAFPFVEGSISIPARVTLDSPVPIGVSAPLLLKVLNALPCSEVEMYWGTGNDPVSFMGGDGSWRVALMPVLL